MRARAHRFEKSNYAKSEGTVLKAKGLTIFDVIYVPREREV
jgi:hypothetical protein